MVSLVKLNVWGTPIEHVDTREYCGSCERALPFHYTNCQSPRQSR